MSDTSGANTASTEHATWRRALTARDDSTVGPSPQGAGPISRDARAALATYFWMLIPSGVPFSTSFAKKYRPSIGTIMICTLSDNRSAMIF